MQTVSLEIPATTFAALSASSDEFVEEMRIAAAVKWYELGKLSQGKAAEGAGLSRSAFIEALSRFQLSPIQITEEELAKELTVVFQNV
jgi:predicted HTH domain antitoxin